MPYSFQYDPGMLLQSEYLYIDRLLYFDREKIMMQWGYRYHASGMGRNGGFSRKRHLRCYGFLAGIDQHIVI